MLDKENYKIVKKLEKLCPDGSYKVFEFSELCSMFGLKNDALENNLEHLKQYEYIDIKYTDESVVCLCVLPKSRQLKEQEKIKSYSYSTIMKVMLMSGVFSALMAFIGAFLAVLIIK